MIMKDFIVEKQGKLGVLRHGSQGMCSLDVMPSFGGGPKVLSSLI